MISKFVLSSLCVLLGALPVLGQQGDFWQLIDRASRLWELRSQAKRVDALQLIEPETRDVYLQIPEFPISSFNVTGVEITADRNRLDVLTIVHSLVPRVGEMDRTVKETWVWKGGQWFMHAATARSPFDTDPNTKPAIPVEFRLSESVIDVGRHAQGDVVEGKIPFHALRSEVRIIRPLQRIPGLTISSAVWTTPSEGYLPYRWETTLVSQNVNQKVSLEAIAHSETRVSADVTFRARIDGRIGFKQVPEFIDTSKNGQVELQLQNLSSKPLKILSAMSYNSFYVIDENVPPSIDPGKSGRILIRYTAQAQPTGASIGLVFSEDLAGLPITTVPLNVQLTEEKRPATYSQEDIKRLVPDAGNPPQRFPN
jgi:hypothetical protein